MSEHFKVAVVGSGPGGISAATHAATSGVSHILLEAQGLHSMTIQKYQKGKHVMAEPNVLPLRADVGFEQGTRENILQVWEDGLKSTNTNVRYNAGVTAISGEKDNFTLTIADGSTITADYVILGIGVQGNPRQLGVEGSEAEFVQYQLDDPDEYHNESIIVVGASDAAIENAVALADHNNVCLINRKDEFARAKEGNRNLILGEIEKGTVTCYYSSTPEAVKTGGDKKGSLVLKTPTGETELPCDRIIARLGAIPQRGLVESFGVEFPNPDPNALPVLSSQYECNVSGMYIIGALGGYPLIKQAMNQGYEVIEYIEGNAIKPADHPLLEEKFRDLPYSLEVDDVLRLMQERIPIFSEVNALMFRELMIDSDVRVLNPGDIVFEKNDYSNTFFTVLDGDVEIEIDENTSVKATQGNFFGEMSLLSGRRRSNTVRASSFSVLIETPRLTMNKLIASVDAVKRGLDEVFVLRAIQNRFAPNMSLEDLRPVAQAAKINSYSPGEVLFQEGDEADDLHLVRSGSLVVCKEFNGRDIPMSYVPANNVTGEMGILGGTTRSMTVKANVATETVSIDAAHFNSLLEKEPELRNAMQELVRERQLANVRMQESTQSGSGDVLTFLMEQGLGEATDVLLIDESLCVACDNCEVACAETHGGTSRLNRKAGPTFATIHVPTSCRHCEDPHCMKDCPPDALTRNPGGEVYIQDNCIGCGNCEQNCPYGVIQMAYPNEGKPGFWSWLLFGSGPGPGQDKDAKPPEGALKKAVKCDMCKDLPGGAACVRACPTGAALRLNPEQFVDLVSQVR